MILARLRQTATDRSRAMSARLANPVPVGAISRYAITANHPNADRVDDHRSARATSQNITGDRWSTPNAAAGSPG